MPYKWIAIGILALALSSAALFAVHSYNSAITRAEAAEGRERVLQADLAAAETARIAAEAEKVRVQAMLDEADELAKQAAEREANERRNNAKLRQDLDELKRSDKAARDWLDGPVPDSVRRLRRSGADSPDGVRREGRVPRPNGTPQPDGRTADGGLDRRRPVERGNAAAVRPAFLQYGQGGHEDVNRKEPEMKRAFLAGAMMMATVAFASESLPVVQAAETNFYDAVKELGNGADGETRRLAIFAAMAARMNERGGGVGPGNAAPQQVVVQAQKTGWDYLFGFLGAAFSTTKDVAQAVAPAYLAYKTGIKQADASVKIADINGRVQETAYGTMLGLGTAGITGVRDTASAGFNVFGRLPPSSVVTNNIAGSTGVNLGAGNLVLNIDSGNTQRTCTGGQAGNSGGTTGGPGGAGGPAAC